MSLGRDDVETILRLLDGSKFDRLTLEHDGLKLELVRNGAAPRAIPSPEPAVPPPPAKAIDPPRRETDREGLIEVRSPLLGTFYRAPKPGEPPFVEVGDSVDEESLIGIIEVMKLMNSARAGVRGEVVEILATNGKLVEYGELLMLVRPTV